MFICSIRLLVDDMSNSSLSCTSRNKQLSFQSVILIHGGRIGFFQGDIQLLMDDLQTLQPTVFPVVPRLLNRICDKVRSA